MTTVLAEQLAAYAGVPVVVLGAAGFIGRWVSRLLSRVGARIYLVVRHPRTARLTFSRYGVRGEVIELDLQKPDRLASLLAEIQPAILFNLAGYGVDATEIDARIGEDINARLIPQLCEALARGHDPQWTGQALVHVGSALEYGAITSALQEDLQTLPTTWYGQTKLEGTRFLADSCTRLGIRGVTARLFTVYGPGEHEGRLLPTLRQAAATGARVPLTAGHQERDFTYVEDVAEGLLRLGVVPAIPGSCVNLATGRLLSVRRFVQAAAPILGLRQEQLGFGLLPGRPHELQHGPVSITRLRQVLQWFPTTEVPAGVTRTAEFLQQMSETEAVS